MADNFDPFVNWLREGLKKPGKSQSGLARHLKLDPSAVNKIVRSTRKLKSEEITSAARYLDEPAPFGFGPLIPVVGRVGADPEGRILYAEGHGTGDFVPLAPGSSHWGVAVQVAGHSMRGLADDGSLIYYEDRRDPPTDDMLDHIVVVGLPTEEILVKRLLRGSARGLYDLESIAGPTRHDARVDWAAHITAIVPPWRARQII